MLHFSEHAQTFSTSVASKNLSSFSSEMAEGGSSCSSSKHIRMTVPDDEFTCPLCCDIFEEPKLLPSCAHSFCKKCLQDLALHSSLSQVSCPICRKISNVPENGVENFLTNTLLVRLIDHIPGKKEKSEVLKALARCKEELERNIEFNDKLKKNIALVDTNKEKREKLKGEISQHANEAVESIRKYEQELLKLVDDFCKESCEIAFHEDREIFEKKRNVWQAHIDSTSACVKNVEETLQRNQFEEIIEMKNVMVEQLNECSTFPLHPSFSEVEDFNVQFKKTEIERNILGEIHKSEKSMQSVQTVALKFEPFRMAVNPRTNQIALLWKEMSQIHIYNSEGQHQSTICVHGKLWDVGFTSDDKIVVVNRANNHLLHYAPDGTFLNDRSQVIPPRDSLKFTFISIDIEGRFIVVSTKVDSDSNSTVIPCIIVYNQGSNVSTKMFGRWHLTRPVSQAIYNASTYYIADLCSVEVIIKCFSFQGEALSNVPLIFTDINKPLTLSVFLGQCGMMCSISSNRIKNTKQAVLISSKSGSRTEAVIYNGSWFMKIVTTKYDRMIKNSKRKTVLFKS